MRKRYRLWQILRPRRSKLLPRQFVLIATRERLVAFKARGVGIGESTDLNHRYEARIKPGEAASFPRAGATVTDLPEGARSESGTLLIGPSGFR